MSHQAIRRWIILVHLFLWVMIIIAMLFIFNGFLADFKIALVATSINFLGFLVLVYVHLLWLLPSFFDQKKYFLYGLGLFFLLLLTAVFRFSFGWNLIQSIGSDLESTFTPSFLGSIFFGGTFMIMITVPLRLIENWFKRKALEKELKTHQLEAELRFLKAQVNPHFLFNALNNIYSLSFTQSEKAPEMILKLSDMMSYMLYDCKSEQVKLSDEIAYLKNYIDLQQLKKDGELNVEFKVEGDFTNLLITPMLFIPFFENAFKHGNLEDLKNGWLKSSLIVDDGKIKFQISNSFRPHSKHHPKGGVGLENIKERLKLLFPDQHYFNSSQDGNIFNIELHLNLKST